MGSPTKSTKTVLGEHEKMYEEMYSSGEEENEDASSGDASDEEEEEPLEEESDFPDHESLYANSVLHSFATEFESEGDEMEEYDEEEDETRTTTDEVGGVNLDLVEAAIAQHREEPKDDQDDFMCSSDLTLECTCEYPPPTPPATKPPASTNPEELLNTIAALEAALQSSITPPEVFDVAHKALIHEKFSPLFSSVQCVLIPMEGVLYVNVGGNPVPTPGAVDSFHKLRKSGLKILLIANTWLKKKESMVKMLNKLGFIVEEGDLFTSSDCCKIFMRSHNLSHPFLLVADQVLGDFKGMDGTLGPMEYDCVVLGLPSTMIDYRLMTKTLNILFEGRPLLVLHPGKKEKVLGGGEIPTQGPYSQILEYVTDVKRFIPSKPSAGFYVEACKYAGHHLENCVIIGDNVEEDVRETGKICLKSILVKTGKYLIGDESKYCGVEPQLLTDNFSKAVIYLLSSTSTDPDREEDILAEEIRKELWRKEHEDFYVRLNAYAEQDCGQTKVVKCNGISSWASIIN